MVDGPVHAAGLLGRCIWGGAPGQRRLDRRVEPRPRRQAVVQQVHDAPVGAHEYRRGADAAADEIRVMKPGQRRRDFDRDGEQPRQIARSRGASRRQRDEARIVENETRCGADEVERAWHSGHREATEQVELTFERVEFGSARRDPGGNFRRTG